MWQVNLDELTYQIFSGLRGWTISVRRKVFAPIHKRRLTTEPGPDVAPYHSRQVVVLGPQDWARWLNPNVPATDVLGPAPAGTLAVAQVR